MKVRKHRLGTQICDTGVARRVDLSDGFRLLKRHGPLAFNSLAVGRSGHEMIRDIGVRPIIFSVNCYIATILTMFIAFSLDLKSPGWAMTTVYLTSQPLSGAMRAKAVYRAIGTFVGAAAMVAIVPNLVDAPELTTLAIMLWVALYVFVSLLDRTPRSYVFVLSG